MSDRLTRRILDHVSHKGYAPTKLRALADELGVEEADYPAFREAVTRLAEAGEVVIGAAETVALPPMGREVTGKFQRHERGFGFVIPESRNAHGDLFVPAGDTGGALTGDRVRAAVVHRKRQGGPPGHSPYTGQIVEVLERGRNRFVGPLSKQGKLYVVHPDGRAMTDAIIVRDPDVKNARVGDKVVVELTKFPEDNFLAEGVITEVLGKPGEPDVETEAICRAFNLPGPFPQEVLEDARGLVARYAARLDEYLEGRTDLRDRFIITIDPPDAKDYDDAISIERTDKGVELGVHIADVGTLVAPGTPLDIEASQRGNSCYLPRRVIPMLPEVLSNGICSLQPGVPRLTRSAFMTYDEEGNVVSTRFAASVIQSAHRLTYLEAQALIDGNPEEARKHAKTDTPHTQQLIDTLRAMDALAKTIRDRRLREGMIVLDLPDVDLVHDETGRVIDAHPEDDAFTHKLIEAFMVEANEAVARVFADLDVPLIRRVHPEPGARDISELRAFARVAGYNIPSNPTRKELQKLLDSVRGTPAAKAVHFAVLRTLTKAEYSPDLIGHFALASEHYTHFTSPIRRYPDLAVHRALDALQAELGTRKSIPRDPRQRKILGNRLRSDKRVLDVQDLRQLGRQCSGTERKAEAAERELRNYLVMQLLEKHVGEEFSGTVTGITGNGIYVQIDKYVIDGMIRVRDLPGAATDRWQLNAHTGSMTAQRSGRTISIGDQFTVRLNKVNLARREMDLLIVSELRTARTPRPVQQGDGQPAEGHPRKKKRQRFSQGGKKKGGRGRRR